MVAKADIQKIRSFLSEAAPAIRALQPLSKLNPCRRLDDYPISVFSQHSDLLKKGGHLRKCHLNAPRLPLEARTRPRG
jgi:hypothetical protein